MSNTNVNEVNFAVSWEIKYVSNNNRKNWIDILPYLSKF